MSARPVIAAGHGGHPTLREGAYLAAPKRPTAALPPAIEIDFQPGAVWVVEVERPTDSVVGRIDFNPSGAQTSIDAQELAQ
jgi:hypothetical protein